jgi:hypothetical protein
MTDQQHPITSPLELSDEQVGKWLIDDGYPWDPSEQAVITITTNRLKNVARQAYQTGADHELEACCKWLKVEGYPGTVIDFRAARRPKPLSLKERSLQLLETYDTSGVMLTADQADTIRRALEALND